MEELAIRKPKARISEVRLRLQSTDVPSDALPRGERGERLILPTAAKLLLRDEGLRIEMIVIDPEEWGNQYYNEPDFDDENPSIIFLNLDREEILSLIVGGYQHHHPTAVLVFNDPLDVVESLTLTFVSTDPNNPQYAIRALTKMLRDGLRVSIEDSKEESTVDRYDIPF